MEPTEPPANLSRKWSAYVFSYPALLLACVVTTILADYPGAPKSLKAMSMGVHCCKDCLGYASGIEPFAAFSEFGGSRRKSETLEECRRKDPRGMKVQKTDIERLLASDESEVIERKESLSDKDGIRDAMIYFANDLAGKGIGWLIIGQSPDKDVKGLKVSNDEAKRIIADIARNSCRPAIPKSTGMSSWVRRMRRCSRSPLAIRR